MPTKTFGELITAIASLLELKDVTSSASLQLIVDEMPVSLMDNGIAAADTFLFVCDFGPAPVHAGRAEILKDLLAFNLFAVSSGAPVFCINPDTDHVLLTGKLAIEQTTPSRLLHGLTEFAIQAREWRHNSSLANLNNNASNSPNSRVKNSRQHQLLHMAHHAIHS